MPNLLKSLPREILDKEDSKFIYNVLNPMLFEKIKDTDKDTIITHSVASLLNKDINHMKEFLPEFILPYNINSREFHVYMTTGQETKKIEYFGKTELVKTLDDLKDYIFFFFSVEGYSFLETIIKKYYYILNEYQKNEKLYKYNYEQYLTEFDVKKKKIYKSTYIHFKDLYDTYSILKIEFDFLFDISLNSLNLTSEQIMDKYASTLGNYYSIKTFDNDIIFSQSKLFSYLTEYMVVPDKVNKHIFSGKNIIGSTVCHITNIFDLIATFSLELTTIKTKYDEYLKLILDNGNGYALERSEFRKIKNEVFKNIHVNLDSDNLTYFIDEKNNKLEIYLYFAKEFRVDKSTFKLKVNGHNINKSIHSLTAERSFGYDIFEYFDDDTKYYKITVNKYLKYDLQGNNINYNIDTIDINFAAIKAIHYSPTTRQDLYLESMGFLDSFELYGKNEQTGFFEALNIPYKIKINIEEKDERYTRSYEFNGINPTSQQALLDQKDIIIGCYDYEYVYEPKLYIDFFKDYDNTINFRFNTILPFVLVDDLMDMDFEISYYTEVNKALINTDITKNTIMFDNGIYRPLYDDVNQYRLINPYNETHYSFVSKLTYPQYTERTHASKQVIDGILGKVGFKDNLMYLDAVNYDPSRNILIFVVDGVQVGVSLSTGLDRCLNYESLQYDAGRKRMVYHGEDLCGEGFRITSDGIYLKNPITDNYDKLEFCPLMPITTTIGTGLYFDIFEMGVCITLDNKKYKLSNIYVDTIDNAKKHQGVLFIDSNSGILMFNNNGDIIDININRLGTDTTSQQSLVLDSITNTIKLMINGAVYYTMPLIELVEKTHKHRMLGLTAFSLFYSGNVIPENTNKSFFGRENIYNSMFLVDDIYKLGRGGDIFNNTQQHALLAEQMDMNIKDAEKYNMEEESYFMFKSSTASYKGLESYLKSNLKSISQNIGISPVYLVQRNRFISEWARVSSILPDSIWAKDALKDLIADLMETKLLNKKYDDLIDIFKNNEYEKFSMDTNNIHAVIIQYILRFIGEHNLYENLTYYLIHNVWIGNNRKKIIDYIKSNASEKIITELSSMTFVTDYEKEQLFYMFVKELEKNNKQTIKSYIPIGNYSDWQLYNENNHVKFEKPYQYDLIDISDFITMPIEWNQPLYLIRPLTDDGLYVKRDYRFLDISMVTNMQVTYDDAYNEYVNDSKDKLNKPVSYLEETLKMISTLSIEHGYDLLSVNLVIVKWVVERFLPNLLLSKDISSVEELNLLIKDELNSAEHPNLVVSYNKIKETTLLGDLGNNITDIYETLINGNMIENTIMRLDVTSTVELDYLDKIKRPVEHFFDYLIFDERYDIITKVLALFTEDVIATSMIDLSFAINIKNTKGDETFNIYEQTIFNIFDEFLPFHTVLDKIIFSILIMETSSGEAVSKNADVGLKDYTMIDIMSNFIEKIRIQVYDRTLTSTRITALFPSEGLKLFGGHDEIPYDYDRKVKVGGHDLPMHMDDFEAYGMDDDWYIINRENWKQRSNDIYMPPEFASLVWSDIPDNELERVAEVYIDEYYHIKQTLFEKDNRIESFFVDFIPVIDINQGVSETPEINVTEDYLIGIDSVFKIRFYDIETIGHDDYGLDETWGPEDQTTLIGAKEMMHHNVMHDFYEKINIGILDSIWTDVVVIYDLLDIPGHDDFAVDEYYHQKSPDLLGQDMSVMVYDSLLEQGFHTSTVEMTDISLVDKHLSTNIMFDYNRLSMNTYISEKYHVTIEIMANRHFDAFGRFLRPGHDEFMYDEYYHDSYDNNRIANIVDIGLYDFMGDIRIDFGFMRMLPMDPYVELINQKFYRANLPGSDWQKTRIRDSYNANIHIYGKDIIRIGLMDFISIDMISENLRRSIYNDIEKTELMGDYFASNLSDSLITRHIHHDFREHIIAIDKYATILTDSDIIRIYGTNAGNLERDELFKMSIGDKYYADIKIKQPIDRVKTKIDKDYLKSIKIEEENFVDFRYKEKDLKVRFTECLRSYFKFREISNVLLNDVNTIILNQINKDNILDIGVMDKVWLGHNHGFSIDGMKVHASDSIKEMWTNKIYSDSMILTVTDKDYNLSEFDYTFGKERIYQPHNNYGHMGYTDESLDRSLTSKITDSLIQTTKENYFDSVKAEIYDGLMHDIKSNVVDYIDVTIAESLHTYIHIVKKPWIFSEFDDFGHNYFPHMYNGDSDEFDVTTELRDSIKIDTYTKLYTTASLVSLYDKINTGYGIDLEDYSSVSMQDNLKVIGVTFNDSIKVDSIDMNISKKKISEPITNIKVLDRVWYGYKLRDQDLSISTRDTVYYTDRDEIENKNKINVNIVDSLFTNYTFMDSKPVINITTHLHYISLDLMPEEKMNITFKEKLEVSKYDNFQLNDQIKVTMRDSLTVLGQIETDPNSKIDKICVVFKEQLEYGRGKKFTEPLRIFALNRLTTRDSDKVYTPDLAIKLHDSVIADCIIPFKDKVGVDTYERMKFGPVFREYLDVSLRDILDIKLLFLDNRYAVDGISHGIDTMEYYDDSSDRAFSALVQDDIKIVDIHYTLKDKLIILSKDQLSTKAHGSTIYNNIVPQDGIVVTSVDNLMYGVGLYDHIWDAKEWETFGYNVPYEFWNGLIPHDEFPYDSMEHNEQGDDLSQVSTGVKEMLFYGLEFLFKDVLTIKTDDTSGFETWGYNSIFKDYVTIMVDNRLETSWIDGDNNNSLVQLRKEFMTLSYEFNDTIKKHEYYSVKDIIREDVLIYDLETHQLIESIMKYRIYEKLDTHINENLLSTSLFKYDEELSLITDFKTKIDLYKTQNDGSIAKTMTVIKDKSTSHVELLFNEIIKPKIIDRIHATYAEKPSEYLD